MDIKGFPLIPKALLILVALLSALPALLRAEETVEMQRLREERARASTSLTIRELHNESGELTHQGITLFDSTMQQALDPRLWQGAERILLHLVLQPDNNSRSRWLNEHNVRLFLEACPFGSGSFKDFARALPILADVTSIKVNEDADRFRFFFTGGEEDRMLRLSVPKDRELIFGTDKKEEDLRVAARLQACREKAASATLPQRDELLPTSTPGLWHTQGCALWIDSLRNDGYYLIGADSVTPQSVWSSRYPKESIRNLMLGIIMPDSLTIAVTHRQYGGHEQHWLAPWPQLLAGLFEESHDKRSAAWSAAVLSPRFSANAQSDANDKAIGILVIRNEQFAFSHMLLLSIPLDLLGSQRSTTLEAMLYTNTPQHNVLSLFGEGAKTN